MKNRITTVCIISLFLLGGCSSLNNAKTNWTDPRAQVINGVKITLKHCSREATNVMCHLSILSSGQMRTIDTAPHGGAQLYDNLGNRYYTSQVMIGNQTKRRVELVPDIDIETTIEFKNISSNASNIKLLSIQPMVFGTNVPTKERKIEFRNIELSNNKI